jgi:hypothetical protein
MIGLKGYRFGRTCALSRHLFGRLPEWQFRCASSTREGVGFLPFPLQFGRAGLA